MTLGVPSEYIEKVIKLVNDHWFKPNLKSFKVKEAEILAGQLAHITNIAPWINHLMPHVYTLIAVSLRTNCVYLSCTSKQFKEQIKRA